MATEFTLEQWSSEGDWGVVGAAECCFLLWGEGAERERERASEHWDALWSFALVHC